MATIKIKPDVNNGETKKNKHIVFDDDGQAEVVTESKPQKIPKHEKKSNDAGKWYKNHAAYNCDLSEEQQLKDQEQQELQRICQSAYEAELPALRKLDPSDARWLQTALHKGTVMDRVNAGALLLTSNPLGNLKTLDTLIAYTKPSNKSGLEVVQVLSNLFQKVLLPTNRKLKSLHFRGNDWRKVRQDEALTKEEKSSIYAQWYFESEFKDSYHEFLKNLQQGIQQGQEHYKSAAIVVATELLASAPEKEQMLLTMVVNKLGDPVAKVASKALHHLTEVAHRHPNMCGVLVAETEKLLFRNNISDRAQHFGLCYLASIATQCASDEVCSKLVNICFALFNVLVQRGGVNSRTMQAILRCLQRAIVRAKAVEGEGILSKDMQDTIYRLAHMAELPISVQTFGLLLQVITSSTAAASQRDRFYNALYRKLADLQLVSVGTRTASQLLHIVHRAMHADPQVQRVEAFIKRLLQMTLYMPPHVSAGCLVVLHKLLRSRRELNSASGEIPLNKETTETGKIYDPYHRVPAFANADNTVGVELLCLQQHFHPTVQVLTECIQNQKKLSYYGDPLQDFSLAHFLERFAFKNPKKATEEPTHMRRSYVAQGARGLPVKTLTANNCTEDEMFIFNYMEQKRNKSGSKKDAAKDKDEDDEDEPVADVNDNEFDEYLNGFFGDKANEDDEEAEDQLEFLSALGGNLKKDKKEKGKKGKQTSENDDSKDDVEEDLDWSEGEAPSDEDNEDAELSDDDMNSVAGSDLSDSAESNAELDFDENDNEEDEDDDESGNETLHEDPSDDDEPPKKQRKKSYKLDDASFAKKLKNSDMSSLFAAAEDFSELLEDTGAMKKQGTSNAVYAKGKLSEKQLKWEEKRHSNKKQYTSRKQKPAKKGIKSRKNRS